MIYLIENNQYGMGTSCARSSCNPDYYTRGDNIPGIRADGQNVFHVKAVIEFCKNYALENGPIYCEAKTYRYHGHSMSDPGLTYRTRDEV
jgi:pyruvate dehydrogenase E1 component alpha subunit